MTAFLGVERSLTDRQWRARAADDRVAMALAQRFDLPDVVCRALVGRGIGIDDCESYLDPTLRRLLPDPSHLKDMDAAVARLVRAIRSGESVAVSAAPRR